MVVSVSDLPSYAYWAITYNGSGPLATTYGVYSGSGSGTFLFELNPGSYTFFYGEASGSPGPWTEIWVPSPSSSGPSIVSSGDTLYLSVSYSGPLPGTFGYCNGDATLGYETVSPGCYSSGSVPVGRVLVDAPCVFTERRIGRCDDGRDKYEVCGECYEIYRVCDGGTFCISSRMSGGAISYTVRVTTFPRTCEEECR